MWPELRAGRPPAPPIAVITRRLDLNLEGRLFARGGPGDEVRTIVLTTEQAPEQRRKAAEAVADVIVAGERDVTGAAAIDALLSRGYPRILAEGGPQLLGELAAAGVLDEVCLTISPVLEGGYSSTRVLAAPGSPPGATDPAAMTGLRLATLLEDDGFLFSRYIRADRGAAAP
jgi:riboflavin biosynthesis pyrimidine reductase